MALIDIATACRILKIRKGALYKRFERGQLKGEVSPRQLLLDAGSVLDAALQSKGKNQEVKNVSERPK